MLKPHSEIMGTQSELSTKEYPTQIGSIHKKIILNTFQRHILRARQSVLIEFSKISTLDWDTNIPIH